MGDGPRTPRVLLVEDDPGDVRLLRETLHADTLAGHVETVQAAVAWLGAQRADVVLLDLGLPDSTGLATLERLLRAHTATPVVVLSGTDDDAQATAAVEAGAQDYLVKGSVDPQVMRRALRHAVERHRLQTDLRERAKEMAGLHAITRELQTDEGPEHVTRAVATRLRAAMRWPQDCHVTVTIDDVTARVGPTPAGDAAGLTAEVCLGETTRGHLLVRDVNDRPFLLPHEQDLLTATADTLGVWLARRDAALTVRRNEQQLRLLVSQMPGLLWTTDTELRVTAYDGTLMRDLGIEPDTLLGTPIVDLFESDRAGPAAVPFRDALAGISSTFERRWQDRSWRNHVEPKRDTDGEVIGVVCLSLDITDERRHEETLAAARARLQGLFDNSADALILTDATGTHLDANPAACQLTGRTHDELVGLHPWDLTTIDPATGLVMWEDFVAAGSMAGEFALSRPDGTTVETEFRAVADIVPGVHLSSMRDVTARKRMEAALASSEERFRMMAEAAQDAIYRVRTTPEYRLEYLNPAIEPITGFSIEDVRTTPDLYPGRTHAEDVHLLHPQRLRPGVTETVTVRFRHAEGHVVWLEDSRSPIVEGDEIVGVQGVIRDVTSRRRTQQALQEALEAERRAAEQLRSADQLKSHFLQAVSHELRTPLTAVLGLSATLVDNGTRLGPEQTTYFNQRVLANARKLDSLLTDLLDLEGLQHGAVRIDRRETDLPRLVARIAQDIEFGGRQVTVEDRPVVAPVDPDQVERIVHNLLANAVKHTPPGTRITVRCDADAEAASIEVADDGPGIPDELALLIFEPFRQGPTSYDAASPGTGIGLSIVRQFAALHGGAAWVSETPGGGATFTVRLPWSQTPRGHPTTSADTEVSEAPPANGAGDPGARPDRAAGGTPLPAADVGSSPSRPSPPSRGPSPRQRRIPSPTVPRLRHGPPASC